MVGKGWRVQRVVMEGVRGYVQIHCMKVSKNKTILKKNHRKKAQGKGWAV